MWNLLIEWMRADSAQDDGTTGGPARALMEGAEACAGLDPARSLELRRAAQAYLSVLR